MSLTKTFDNYNTVVNCIKKIKALGYKQFDLSVLFQLTKEQMNQCQVLSVLRYLVNKNKLYPTYRVYNSKDSHQYIDYHEVKDIPEDKYTHNDKYNFYVDKMDKISVSYQIK